MPVLPLMEVVQWGSTATDNVGSEPPGSWCRVCNDQCKRDPMKSLLTREGLVAALCTAFTACQKYEDGPAFSLRSREERVANDWRVERAMDGSDDVTSAFDQYELRLSRERDATLIARYTLGEVVFEFSTSGEWEFQNHSEDLRLDFENDAADETYEILRLKDKELWLREKGDDLELHLAPM